MKHILAAACLLPLAACIPAIPLVSDYNGDSVKIQASSFAEGPEAEATVLAEANRICGKKGRKAEYASTRQLPDYNAEHLFLCL